ncbi:DMT family transporter [Pseudomonas chlororaphis]|uniref:EamA family transporter n=1 Tax=Pseudomonas chlororaphis TaxID=587753 RepID=A0A1Q8ETM7_9PSED|nr:DMT family transporter [Pseudomonas chlororaphis]OLF55138.1 EamA family transporter [Pseudomonas chlororaphis]
MKSSPALKVVLATAVVILCWAYSPVGIHIGLEGYEPGHLALLRFLIASLFMGVIALVRKISLPRWRDLPWLLVLGFFAIALHHVSLNHGQQGLSAGASSVLAQSAPIFSTLIAFFWLKEPVSGWRWGCVALGVFGAVVVVWGDQGVAAIRPQGLLVLLAAFSWGLYFVLQRRYSGRYDLLTTVCYMVWAGTLLLSLYGPGLAVAVARAPWRVNLAVLLLGVFPSALAYLAWAYVLARVEVSRASVAMYLIPPIAMLLAALTLQERVHAAVVVGAAIVLGSVMAMQWEGRWSRRRSVLVSATGVESTHSRAGQNTRTRCPSGSRATKV